MPRSAPCETSLIFYNLQEQYEFRCSYLWGRIDIDTTETWNKHRTIIVVTTVIIVVRYSVNVFTTVQNVKATVGTLWIPLRIARFLAYICKGWSKMTDLRSSQGETRDFTWTKQRDSLSVPCIFPVSPCRNCGCISCYLQAPDRSHIQWTLVPSKPRAAIQYNRKWEPSM
jgi:hypothetical protein